MKSQEDSITDIKKSRVSNRMNEKLVGSFLDRNFFVPEALLTALDSESQFLISDSVYDPSVGTLFDISPVSKADVAAIKDDVMAFAGGESSSMLNLSRIYRKDVECKVESNAYIAETPRLTNPTSIDFQRPITQVVFSKEKMIADKKRKPLHPFLAVRTTDAIFLLQVKISLTDEICVELLEEVSKSAINNDAFAHVEFCRWSANRLCIIDVAGNFRILQISRMGKIRYVCDPVSLYDPTELSSFRRLLWGNDKHELFLISRSSIVRYDIANEELEFVVTAKTWSYILDLQRPPLTNQYAVLLTSKEVLLVFMDGKTLSRLVSWKHNLDEQDPSLKLTLETCVNPENTRLHYLFNVCIYSQAHPLNYVMQFGVDFTHRAFLAQDPYLLQGERDTMTQTMGLFPINITHPHIDRYNFHKRPPLEGYHYALWEMSADMQLSYRLLSTFKNLEAEKTENDLERLSFPLSDVPHRSAFFGVSRKAIEIRKELGSFHKASSEDEIQRLAYAFGSKLTRLESAHSYVAATMSQELTALPALEDLEELDSMLSQLAKHSQDKGVELKTMNPDEVQKVVGCEAMCFTDICSRLEAMTPNQFEAKCVAASVGLGMTKFVKEGKPEEMDKSILPPKIAEVFNQWGSVYSEQELSELMANDILSQRFASQSTFELPSINISSSQAQSQPLRSQLDTRHSKRHGIKLESSALSGSQKENSQFSQSDTQRKKKKKRKGGFA